MQKMTQNRVQILGFESCDKTKTLPYSEKITWIHYKTMKITCHTKSDREIY